MVPIPILFPNAITCYDHKLLLSITLNFDDIRHASYWLLIKWKTFHFFVAEISNRPCQIQTIDSSLNYRHSCFVNPLFLHRILRLMVERQWNALFSLPERCTRISCVGANYPLFSNCHYNSGRSCIELLSCSIPTQLLRFILDQLLNPRFELHHQLYMYKSLSQGLSNFSFAQRFSLTKNIDEVSSNEFRDLPPSMAIKNPKDSDMLMTWDFHLCDVGILHVLPPTLHFTDSELIDLILFPGRFFGGNWFFQIAIAHYINKYEYRLSTWLNYEVQ